MYPKYINKTNVLILLAGIIILAGTGYMMIDKTEKTSNIATPSQAEVFKLRNSYSSDIMSFQYPDGYIVERDNETKTLSITGENSRIEIVLEDVGDFPFAVEDGQDQEYADRNIPKEIQTQTGSNGTYDIKQFYQMNDRKMKELLGAIVETIVIR